MRTPKWEAQLWEELDSLPTPQEQIVTAGEWIVHLNQVVLPELAARRRLTVVDVLNEPGMDAATLAGQIGSRVDAIKRLKGQGLALRRGEATD